MLGKDSTEIFCCCFFMVMVTTMVGWIPSEASLWAFRLNRCFCGFCAASSVCRAGSGFSSEKFKKSSRAKGFRSDRARLMRGRWRQGQQTLTWKENRRRHRHGNSCSWCSGVVKREQGIWLQGFSDSGHSLHPALPMKECWENTQRTHWHKATRL